MSYRFHHQRWFAALGLLVLTMVVLVSTVAQQVRADSPSIMPDVLDNAQLSGFTCEPSASIQLGSVSSDGVQNDVSGNLNSLTSDGRYLYFPSRSANLVANDTNGAVDYFEFDRTNCQTRRITVGPNGEQGDGNSDAGDVSGNGQYFVFASKASTFVVGDTNNKYDIFVKNLQTGAVTRIAADPNNAIPTTYYIGDVSISNDGRYVTFDVLVPAGTPSGFVGTPILYDLQTSTRIQIALEGRSLYLSGDGQYIAFVSSQSNLVANDTNNVDDVFVYERATGNVSRVSVMTDGTQSFLQQYYPSIAISGSGRFVSFTSLSSMVANDSNGLSDVYMRDRQANQTTLVSLNTDGSQIVGGAFGTALSADGRYVFFLAGSLTVRDRQTHQTYTITSPEPSNGGLEISDDGQYLAFSTSSGVSPNIRRNAYVAHRAGFAPATPTFTPTYTPTNTFTPTPTYTPTAAASAAPPRNFYTIRTPTLTWNRVTWATDYEIQISHDQNFAPAATFTTSVPASSLSYITDTLANGTYYWRVKAIDSTSNTFTVSSVDSFVIAASP